MNLVKNTLLASISNFSNLFLFLLLIIVGRVLGIEEYGKFTFAIAFVAFFELIVDLGTRDIILREVSRNLKETVNYVGNFLIWHVLVALFGFIVLVFFTWIFQYSSELKTILYILGIAAFLKKIKFVDRLYLHAHNAYGIDTLLVLFERTILLVFSILVIMLWKNILVLSYVFLIVRFIDVIILYVVIHKKITSIRFKLDWKLIKYIQIQALPKGIYMIIFVLLSYISIIMLGYMSDYKEVGLFNAAFKLFEGVNILPQIFYMSILPRLFQLYSSSLQAHADLSKRVLRYLFIIAVPIGLIFILNAKFFLFLFYKLDSFLEATLILKILMAGLFIHFPLWILNMVLLSTDHQKQIMFNGFIALVFNVLLNWLLIPSYGALGAAIATVLSDVVLFSVAWIFIQKKCFNLPIHIIGGKPIAAGLIMFIIVFSLQFNSVLLNSFLLISGYMGLLFLFKSIEKVELVHAFRELKKAML